MPEELTGGTPSPRHNVVVQGLALDSLHLERWLQDTIVDGCHQRVFFAGERAI